MNILGLLDSSDSQMRFLYLLLAVGVVVTIVFGVLLFFRIRKERRKYRDLYLTNLKEKGIRPILDKSSGPAQEFRIIEAFRRDYKVTEAELGMNMRDILIHAVECQRKRVLELERHLDFDAESAQARLSIQKGESWARLLLTLPNGFKSTLDALESAREEHKTIEARLHSLEAMDLKTLPRFYDTAKLAS